MSNSLDSLNAPPGPQSPLGSSTPIPVHMFSLEVSIGEAQNLVAEPV